MTPDTLVVGLGAALGCGSMLGFVIVVLNLWARP